MDQLLASAGVTSAESGAAVRARKTAAEARTKLRRLQEAIAAGANPVALVDMINQAQAELEAAQAEQAQRPEAPALTRGDVYAMIDTSATSERHSNEPTRLSCRDSTKL